MATSLGSLGWDLSASVPRSFLFRELRPSHPPNKNSQDLKAANSGVVGLPQTEQMWYLKGSRMSREGSEPLFDLGVVALTFFNWLYLEVIGEDRPRFGDPMGSSRQPLVFRSSCDP